MSKGSFRQAVEMVSASVPHDDVSPEVEAILSAGIRTKLARRRLRRRVLPIGVGLALASATATLVWGTGLFVSPTPAPRWIGGFVLAARTRDTEIGTTADNAVFVQRGECTLADQTAKATLHLIAGSRVRQELLGIRVEKGRVQFDVEHHPQESPTVRVLVSGGVIEVLGTAFEVTQDDGGGSVVVTRGTVRFTAVQGGSVVLREGQRHAWIGDRPPPMPPPANPTAAKKGGRAGVRHVDVKTVLDRVAVLRSRGLYEEAVGELYGALGGDFAEATREKLSFECGAILTFTLRDHGRGCAHWAMHQQQFPDGEYGSEVARAKRALSCKEDARE